MLRITRFVWELSNRWHNTQLKTHPCSAHHLAGHPILMCCLWACFNILWHFPCNAFGFGCVTFRPPQRVRCYKLSDWLFWKHVVVFLSLLFSVETVSGGSLCMHSCVCHRLSLVILYRWYTYVGPLLNPV